MIDCYQSFKLLKFPEIINWLSVRIDLQNVEPRAWPAVCCVLINIFDLGQHIVIRITKWNNHFELTIYFLDFCSSRIHLRVVSWVNSPRNEKKIFNNHVSLLAQKLHKKERQKHRNRFAKEKYFCGKSVRVFEDFVRKFFCLGLFRFA